MNSSRIESDETSSPAQPQPNTHLKLWNWNFVLLWQGQLVSALGDTVYAIALGFWILSVTGSTAIMGTLMAVSSLPRVLIAPCAGVIVDRSNRKWILVFMDALRGLIVVGIGIATYTGIIQIWMVFVAGIIISVCGAFFNPSVSSSIPDIVPKDKLVQANSLFSILYTGSGIIGNSGGGFLYAVLGAPFMFLFNGVSYVFSAVTECIIKIPKLVHTTTEWSFFKDLRDGFSFIWDYKGLRLVMILAGVLNFFSNIGIMLFLPLFEQQPHLGPGLYGLFMGFFTGGLFLGYVLASTVSIKPAQRFRIFVLCGVVVSIGLILIPLCLIFPLMAFLAFIVGACNSILNSFIMAVMQMTTPQNKRGKVFGLLTSIAGALTPIAFAIGGILAEVFSVRLVIAGSFIINLIFFIPLFLNRDFQEYIGFDPTVQPDH
ncbi:MFS transporter [candidate division WOR-3 bacterium]|nr:MFS transporter [candidate division WOR-3 bacterium]